MSGDRTTTIREATVRELPRLFAHGKAFYEEMGLPGGFVSDVAEATWRLYMGVLPSVVFVAEHESTIEGMLGAIITKDPYDARPVATEMFWYADPGASPSVALLLLRAFHRWAKEKGAVESRLTHLLAESERTKDQERLKKLYEKMGYAPIEVNYLRKVPQKGGGR